MKDLKGEQVEFDAEINSVKLKDGVAVIQLTAAIHKLDLNALSRMQAAGIRALFTSDQTSLPMTAKKSDKTDKQDKPELVK